MSEELRVQYAGCFPESHASHYLTREYSHTDERGVNYYDCWISDADVKNPFAKDRLAPKKLIQEASRFLRDRNINEKF